MFPKHLGGDNTHLARRVYHDVVEERRLVASEMSEVIRLLILRVLNWPDLGLRKPGNIKTWPGQLYQFCEATRRL